MRAAGAAAAALLALTAVSEIVLVLLRALGESTGPAEVVNGVLVLVTIPVFLAWFSRTHHNAGLWGPQRRARGWAVGAWFTPGVNFWFPYQIAADASTPEQVGAVESPVLLGLVRAWWACWLLALATGIRFTHPAHGFGIEFGLGYTVASSAFAALGALLGMRMVRRLSAAQEARAALGPLYLAAIRPVPPAGPGTGPGAP